MNIHTVDLTWRLEVPPSHSWKSRYNFIVPHCFSKSFHFCLRFKGFVNKMSRLFYQFSSVIQLCPTVCDPMDCSTPGLPVHHQLPELTQTHVHRVGAAIQPSLPLSSPFPPAFNPSQHQGLFQLVSSSQEVDKVLEFQLYQSFQWTPRADCL